MLKKVNLLAIVIITAVCLPLSAEVEIKNSSTFPFGATSFAKYYEQDLQFTKFIAFYDEDIGLSKADIKNYLTSKTTQQKASSLALAFLYNQAASQLLAEGYEVVYFGTFGIGLEDEKSANVRRLGYYAFLAMPTKTRLTSHQSADDINPFSLSGQMLTMLDKNQIETYLAQNNLAGLAGRYQKGYTLEFETNTLFSYRPPEGEPPRAMLVNNVIQNYNYYLHELSKYKELIEAGYEFLGCEVLKIPYNAKNHKIGSVAYRATFAKP